MDSIPDSIHDEEQVETMFSLLDADHSQAVTHNDQGIEEKVRSFSSHNIMTSEETGAVSDAAAVDPVPKACSAGSTEASATESEYPVPTAGSAGSAVALATGDAKGLKFGQKGSVEAIYIAYHCPQSEKIPTHQQLAEEFGCSRNTISMIVRDMTYTDVTAPLKTMLQSIEHKEKSIKERESIDFFTLIKVWNFQFEGLSGIGISKILELNHRSVSNILNGKRHDSVTKYLSTTCPTPMSMFSHWTEDDFATAMHYHRQKRENHLKMLFSTMKVHESARVLKHGGERDVHDSAEDLQEESGMDMHEAAQVSQEEWCMAQVAQEGCGMAQVAPEGWGMAQVAPEGWGMAQVAQEGWGMAQALQKTSGMAQSFQEEDCMAQIWQEHESAQAGQERSDALMTDDQEMSESMKKLRSKYLEKAEAVECAFRAARCESMSSTGCGDCDRNGEDEADFLQSIWSDVSVPLENTDLISCEAGPSGLDHGEAKSSPKSNWNPMDFKTIIHIWNYKILGFGCRHIGRILNVNPKMVQFILIGQKHISVTKYLSSTELTPLSIFDHWTQDDLRKAMSRNPKSRKLHLERMFSNMGMHAASQDDSTVEMAQHEDDEDGCAVKTARQEHDDDGPAVKMARQEHERDNSAEY